MPGGCPVGYQGTGSIPANVTARAGRPEEGGGAVPTRGELEAAYGAVVPDLVGPGVRVLLVGINPSLYSGWTATHFARPGNRLWRTLHEAGFSDRRLHPSESEAILAAGLGITNLVARATARADELTDAEVQAGVQPLGALVRRCRRKWGQPSWVAFLGISTYRVAFRAPRATVGRQPGQFEGAGVWVLPNPSGLNAHYQQPDLTAAYAELRKAIAC